MYIAITSEFIQIYDLMIRLIFEINRFSTVPKIFDVIEHVASSIVFLFLLKGIGFPRGKKKSSFLGLLIFSLPYIQKLKNCLV